MTESNDLGIQPLDSLMLRLKLTNHDLVAASAHQLTHKVVAKGRKGRRLTVNAQYKILSAFQVLRPQNPVSLKELFNY